MQAAEAFVVGGIFCGERGEEVAELGESIYAGEEEIKGFRGYC